MPMSGKIFIIKLYIKSKLSDTDSISVESTIFIELRITG